MGCQNQNGFWKVFVCECDLQDNWARAGQGENAPRGMTVSATGFGMSELKKAGGGGSIHAEYYPHTASEPERGGEISTWGTQGGPMQGIRAQAVGRRYLCSGRDSSSSARGTGAQAT